MNPNTSKAAIKSKATTGATTLITSKPVIKKLNSQSMQMYTSRRLKQLTENKKAVESTDEKKQND